MAHVPDRAVATRSKLIVVIHPDVEARAMAEIGRVAGAEPRPLFGHSRERLRHEAERHRAARRVRLPDLSVYHSIEAPEERMTELAHQLRGVAGVHGAYVKAPADAPVPPDVDICAPLAAAPPPQTPNFRGHQGYLGPAPKGIDAKYAWTRPGGRGQGVRIIDIEREWRFTHEDLLMNWGGVLGGYPVNLLRERNHGTAVIGILGGDRNAYGINGICPDASLAAISTRAFGMSATTVPGTIETSAAIRQAALTIPPPDIIVLELQREGPPNFVAGTAQIPVEWWPDDFDAIQYATALGIIVVEAAGNGFRNLDDAGYDEPATGFPGDWTNPFNRANRDSGAIVVGAGAPPAGNFGPDRSRLDFSNHGSMLDAQGWGRQVATTGYGCLQGGAAEDRWYMDQFGGTSAATAMVAAALACVQGYRRATGRPLLTPAEARDRLRATGSAQTNAPGRPATERIGSRPNLKQLIPPQGPKRPRRRRARKKKA